MARNLRRHRGRTHRHDGHGGTACGVVAQMAAPEYAPRVVTRYVPLPDADRAWRWTTREVDCAKCLRGRSDFVSVAAP